MTEEIADLLKGLPIDPVRFAFDNMQEDGYYQSAVWMLVKRGFKSFMTYVLYNYKDTPEDFYYRLRETVKLDMETGISVSSFPMRYQPIMAIDPKRRYVGEKWTLQKRKGFPAIRGWHSWLGTVSPKGGGIFKTAMEEFEYWFGKDAKEFDRLLGYPKLRKLLKRKAGALRMARAKGVKA